jgi:hypothetical protein
MESRRQHALAGPCGVSVGGQGARLARSLPRNPQRQLRAFVVAALVSFFFVNYSTNEKASPSVLSRIQRGPGLLNDVVLPCMPAQHPESATLMRKVF